MSSIDVDAVAEHVSPIKAVVEKVTEEGALKRKIEDVADEVTDSKKTKTDEEAATTEDIKATNATSENKATDTADGDVKAIETPVEGVKAAEEESKEAVSETTKVDEVVAEKEEAEADSPRD